MGEKNKNDKEVFNKKKRIIPNIMTKKYDLEPNSIDYGLTIDLDQISYKFTVKNLIYCTTTTSITKI